MKITFSRYALGSYQVKVDGAVVGSITPSPLNESMYLLELKDQPNTSSFINGLAAAKSKAKAILSVATKGT
jgi:hypothetical protein